MEAHEDTLTLALRGAESWEPLDVDEAFAAVSAALFDAAPTPVMLGRYVVLKHVGRGGSGAVYSGFDPEIRRAVAIKVLRPGGARGDEQRQTARLREEAQAIARVAHPNVVAVYDVGTIPADHPHFRGGVFIVMELIEGQPLGRWADGHARRWRPIVEVMLQVGGALAAAHRAGLVHRDVKPGNILVDGDGRARLVDFGLAAAQTNESDDDASNSAPRAGGVLGTPVTMAPEQHQGLPVDQRTDQYGFCAALHLAIAGGPPFEADSMPALLHVKQTTPPRPLPADVPQWLTSVVARGLTCDPERRFEDMDALVAALRRGLGRRRAAWTVGLALVGAVVVVSSFGIARHATSPTERCRARGDARIDDVWGDAARERARAGLVATGAAEADTSFLSIDRAIAATLARWQIVHGSVCEGIEATADAGETSAAIECLDGVLGEVDELAWLLRDADLEVARGAARAAARLSTPDACLVARRPQPDSAPLDALLRRARLHAAAGKIDSATELARRALELSIEAGDVDARARARLVLCDAARDRGRRAEVDRECEAALLDAERAGNDALAVEALLARVRALEGRGEAHRLLRLAEARAERLPHRDAWLAVESLAVRVTVEEAEFELDDALATAQAGLALAEDVYGASGSHLVPLINGVGHLQHRLGRFSEAAASFDRAIAITERARGSRHPDIGLLLNNLGGVELDRGRDAQALSHLERALSIKIESAGEDSPRLVNTLLRIARVCISLRDEPAARAASDRAIAIARAEATTEPLLLARALVVDARIGTMLGRPCAGPLTTLESARAIFDAVDPDHESIGELDLLRGRCLMRGGELAEAHGAFADALARIEYSYDGGAGDLVAPLLELARLALVEGRDADAAASVARAAAIAGQQELAPALAVQVENAQRDLSSLVRQPEGPVVALQLE